jgi:hypothetical protein
MAKATLVPMAIGLYPRLRDISCLKRILRETAAQDEGVLRTGTGSTHSFIHVEKAYLAHCRVLCWSPRRRAARPHDVTSLVREAARSDKATHVVKIVSKAVQKADVEGLHRKMPGSCCHRAPRHAYFLLAG